MVVVLFVLSAVIGLTAMGLILSRVKEMHDWGYSWGYSFFQVLGGF